MTIADDRYGQALRCFDIESTLRFAKNTLGWTAPDVRTPEQADRWTWLMCATRHSCAVRRWGVLIKRDRNPGGGAGVHHGYRAGSPIHPTAGGRDRGGDRRDLDQTYYLPRRP